MINIPRIMIAAPSSGSGKTTIVCGLLKALINKGVKPISFKCGPDYIDPLFHSKVLGIKSRNLDLFLNDENTVRCLFSENSKGSDISVIEGVMGYYDGVAGKSLKASSYDVSRVTKTPVILVINSRGKSLSIIPEIKGFIDYKIDSNIKGVILNNMSPMIYPEIKELIEKEINVKVLGYLPKSEDISLESRHLGLVTADEVKDIENKLSIIGEKISNTVNIDEIINIANESEPIGCEKISIQRLDKVKIAIARDKAFCFYYEDNLSLLKKMGAEIIEFSPLEDKLLPEGIDGLIIGGGYPELYVEKLSMNKSLLNDIKEKLEFSLPCLAECGGYMYLGKSIEGEDGNTFDMVNYFDHHSYNHGKLSRFGYITLAPSIENNFLEKAESINGHEFHYWDSTKNGNAFIGRKPLRRRQWDCINFKDNTLAGYPHIHYYSNLSFPYNFIKTCNEYKRKKQ